MVSQLVQEFEVLGVYIAEAKSQVGRCVACVFECITRDVIKCVLCEVEYVLAEFDAGLVDVIPGLGKLATVMW